MEEDGQNKALSHKRQLTANSKHKGKTPKRHPSYVLSTIAITLCERVLTHRTFPKAISCQSTSKKSLITQKKSTTTAIDSRIPMTVSSHYLTLLSALANCQSIAPRTTTAKTMAATIVGTCAITSRTLSMSPPHFSIPTYVVTKIPPATSIAAVAIA